MVRWVAGVCLLAALAVQAPLRAYAQAVPPAAAASASEAAMERARRQAANPLRVILEASKTRRKANEPDAADVPDTPAQRSASPRQAPLASPASAADAGAARGVQPAAAALVTAPPAPAEAPASPISTQITLSSEALQARPEVSPVAGLAIVTQAPALNTLPAPAAATAVLAAAAAPAAVPRLISMVEPALPARVMEEASRFNELPVDLTIRADGTVAQVAVGVNASRPLVRAVVLALEQWRFEPFTEERVHRVQLVFNNAAR